MHKGIVQQLKFKARNQNAIDVESTMNNMRDTLYNLIRNNRNNATQKISIGITKQFCKSREVRNDRDLVDSFTGTIQRRGTILILINERVYDNKYRHSNVFTLFPRSSIRKLLDNLTTS